MKQEFINWTKDHSELVSFVDEEKEIIYLKENFRINCAFKGTEYCYLENGDNLSQYYSLSFDKKSENFITVNFDDEEFEISILDDNRLLFLINLLKLFQVRTIGINI